MSAELEKLGRLADRWKFFKRAMKEVNKVPLAYKLTLIAKHPKDEKKVLFVSEEGRAGLTTLLRTSRSAMRKRT